MPNETTDTQLPLIEESEETPETSICRDCSESTENEEDLESGLCQECRDTNYFTCGDCDDLTPLDDRQSTESHGEVCSDCYSRKFRQCFRCYYSYRRNVMVYSDQRREYFCQDCYDENPDMEEDEDNEDSLDCDRIHEYSYSPDLIFYGDKGPEKLYTIEHRTVKCRDYDGEMYEEIRRFQKYSKTRFFGVELECNSQDQDDPEFALDALNGSLDKENHAYLKEDSSICGGFEIVTHPHTLKAHRALWEEFFAGMPRQGLTSYKSGHCGMHVHVSRASLSELQRRRIIVFLNAPENKAYIETIAQRQSNSYSQLDPNKKIQYRLSDKRYEAYNTSNSSTDEFRLFRGTTRKDRFFKNLEFVDACIDFCFETNYPGLTFTAFVAWVEKRANKYRYLHNFHIEKGYASGTPLKHSKIKPVTPVLDVSA